MILTRLNKNIINALAWLSPKTLLVGLLLAFGLKIYLDFSTPYGQDPVKHDIQGNFQILKKALLTDLGPDSGTEPRPPEVGMDGIAVELPHRAGDSEYLAKYFNYRIQLPTDAGDSAWGLCVPQIAGTASVWLNGVELVQSLSSLMGLHDWTMPHYIDLPAGSSGAAQQLDIRVRTFPMLNTGLLPIWIGDRGLVRHACSDLMIEQQANKIAVHYLLGLFGLIGIGVFFLKKEVAGLSLFLLAVVVIGHQYIARISWTEMSESAWIRLYLASRLLRPLPVFIFVLSYTGQWNSLNKKLLLTLYGVAYAVLLFLPPMWLPVWRVVLVFLIAPGLVWLLILIFIKVRRKATYFGCLMLAALIMSMVGNGIIFFSWLGHIPFQYAAWREWGMMILAVAMVALVLEELFGYLQAEAQVAEDLRTKVAEQSAKIEADLAKLHEKNQKIAVLEERRRIVRDMHDGLGSHLVSASTLLKNTPADTSNAQAALLIDAALSELRSVLDVLLINGDQLTGDDDPISMLLGKIRHRIGPTLRVMGIEVFWSAQELPANFLVGDHQRLELMRLVQEVFSNIIKHSRAKKVYFRSYVDMNAIIIEIQDDGVGLPPNVFNQERPTGHGLRNMRQRAGRIGAKIHIDNSHPGVCVRLDFAFRRVGELSIR